MFLLTEARYQFARNRGRSVLLILISALLCGCVAVYMGNISFTQQALDQLEVTTPVIMRVVNADGSASRRLDIFPHNADKLLELGLKDLRITSSGNAAFDPSFKGMDPFMGGDSSVLAVNCAEAAKLEAAGRDGSLDFLTGSEAMCVMDEAFASRNGIEQDDTIRLELYQTVSAGTGFVKLSDNAELTVASICGSDEGTGDTIYVPLEWMRQLSVEAGYSFMYSSFSGVLADPMRLNDFKTALPSAGFTQPFGEVYNRNLGDCVSVEDEMFIKTARRLGENLKMFQTYLPAFCAAVAGLVTLVIFLVLKGARRDMAIACSLGRPKRVIGAAHLLSLLCTQFVGMAAVLPVMLLAGFGSAAAGIGLSFMLCTLIGDLLGLLVVLRFDALQLLLAEK